MNPRAAYTIDARLHWIDTDILIASRGARLVQSSDAGATWRQLTTLPCGTSGVLSRSRIARRLMRSGVYHVVPGLHNELVVMAFGQVFVVSTVDGQLLAAPTPIHGSRPLALAKSAGNLYYGEYHGNSQRGPMRVFRSHDGGRNWEVVWTFAGIRHIHTVLANEDEIWVTTGDLDEECGIWVTRDEFRTMDRIVGGEQRYRAVQLLFDQGSVFYGTDAPNSPNYICRLDRRSGVVERVQTVEGPVFYGCIAGDCMYFSTVCEPTDIGRNREAGVWQRGLHDSNWVRVLSFQKDIWPMRLCQYGQVVFPAGSMSNALLWLSPMATEHDQNSLAFRFADLRRKSIDC